MGRHVASMIYFFIYIYKDSDMDLEISIDWSFYFQVSSALHNLRQRYTYNGNSPSPWLPPGSFIVQDYLPYGLDSSLTQELASSVFEIIKGSRLRAHAMVDAAIQVGGLSPVS